MGPEAAIEKTPKQTQEEDEALEAELLRRLHSSMSSLERSSRLPSLTKPKETTAHVDVTIVSARNLPNYVDAGTVDSFIRVVVGKHTATTRVEWDTLNPDFDESFSIPIDPSRTRTILFQVYHHDIFGPKPIGTVEFDVRDLEGGAEIRMWKSIDGSSSKGDICFAITLVDDGQDVLDVPLDQRVEPTSPAHFGTVPARDPQSPTYKAFEMQSGFPAVDPWSVMESNETYFGTEEEEARATKLVEVYYDWDLDASGSVDFEEINAVLLSFRGCDQQDTHLGVLQKWGTLVRAKQIPEEGYDRDMLIWFIIRLTNTYKTHEFDRFTRHISDTSQLLLEITDTGRQRKAFWRLFKIWDTDRSLTLDSNQLEAIISETEYGKANSERLQAGLRALREKAPEMGGIDDVGIRDFHLFMEGLVEGVTEMEVHYIVGQIRTALRTVDLDDPHIVCKHLAANKVLYGKDRTKTNVVADDEITTKLMYQVQSDARHAFDALTLEDIEAVINDRNPTDRHRIIATPVCLLFGLQPAEEMKTTKLCYWEGLKNFIIDDPHRFLHFLQNFEAKNIPYDLMQKIIIFHFKEESDPHRLLLFSRFLSCLCVWSEATVRLACMINGWEYPPPPRHDPELINPTWKGHDGGRPRDRTPGYMKAYPPPTRLGIDVPPRKLVYRLPQWAQVQGWTGDEEPLPSRVVSNYEGPSLRQNQDKNRPLSCVTPSGSSNRLTTLLELARATVPP